MGFRRVNYGLPRLFCCRVMSRHATDRQTDRQTPPSFHNAPSLLRSGYNNTQECIFGDVNHDKVIARVHAVHLKKVELRQAAADPQTKSTNLGCESALRLLFLYTSTIVI